MRRAILLSIGIAALTAPFVAFAHGESAGGGSMSGMMSEDMMTLMHDHLDVNAGMDCETMGDEMLIEHGEGMMEDMIGTEDHERMEAAMNDEDYDAMHAMMGMMASGCVGEDAGALMASRYAAPSAPQARTGSGGMLAIGLLGGLALGVLGAGFFRRGKSSVPAPPSA